MKASGKRPQGLILYGVALAALLVMATACQLPPPGGTSHGTIEVCKSSANGQAGKTFSFTINGGTAFTVKGGSCSGPKSVPSGNATVHETVASGSELVDVTSNHLVNKNIAAANAVVSVAAGSTAQNETLVTFVNQPSGGTTGLLKVCKASPDPSLQGKAFSFTENGGAAFSVDAGTPAAPKCGPTTAYAVGTRVAVAERAVPNTQVSSITVSDNRGSNPDPAGGTITATVGTGVTIVTYTNIVQPVAQTGFIEVCKQAGDQFTSGQFGFTITAPGYTSTQSVRVGQCTGPLEVPAGNVNVAEASRANNTVQSIVVDPSDRLVQSNLTNGTATVSVPSSAFSNDETLVTFTNAAKVALVKVCKTLDRNAAALAGQPFDFNLTSVAGTRTVTVYAGDAGTTTCVLVSQALPQGSQVVVTEMPKDNVRVTGVSVSPSSADLGSTVGPPASAKLTVLSGITTATFTNQALGVIEVCKTAADASTASQTFQFVVNSGSPVAVPAGQCSNPIVVPAGTATVAELNKANFTLQSVTANGGHLLSGPTTNPATVSVDFGGVANETRVTFTNRVNTGSFKVCKASSEQSLQGRAFSFTTSYTVNGGTPVTATIPLVPGQCSNISADIPVVQANGSPVTVNVSEAATQFTAVSSIDVAGAGTTTAKDTAARTVSFSQGPGTAVATFTNVVSLP